MVLYLTTFQTVNFKHILNEHFSYYPAIPLNLHMLTVCIPDMNLVCISDTYKLTNELCVPFSHPNSQQ